MREIRRATFGWPEIYEVTFEDGYGYGLGQGWLRDPNWGGHNTNDLPDGKGMGDGWGHDSDGSGASSAPLISLLVADSDGRRTERVFLCAGCVGGFECPIHGRRL